jgi:hypothetical protein
VTGLSLIAVVIVTDQDDCSAEHADLYDAEGAGKDPPLRCAERPESLYTIDRYVNGLKALRPGNEQLVILSVIAGVPQDLDEAAPDFADNPATQAEYFGRILADPRMRVSALPDGSTAPSCQSEHARATPPRRLAKAVEGFGANGLMTSICDGDWSPAFDTLIAIIARQLGAVCLPRPLPRSVDGRASCEVIWELPPSGDATTITSCDEAPTFLTRDPEQPLSEGGGQRCIAKQLAVSGPPEARVVELGDGWYYDDFSASVMRECTTTPKQNIAWSEGIAPPNGVKITIECTKTTVLVPAVGELRVDAKRPELHDGCEPQDPNACARALQDELGGPSADGFDRTLVCDAQRALCVLPPSIGDCPKGFTWDPALSPFCEPDECQVPG